MKDTERQPRSDMPLLRGNASVSLTPQRPPCPADEDAKLRWGWLGYRPDYLQRFNTPKGLVRCLCLAAIIQGINQMGFVNVCLTTIEKRFHLKSQDTGTIVGAFNIAFVTICLPVSFLASRPKASKPRWLGWGMVVMGLGSILYTMPHFMVPPYSVDTADLPEYSVAPTILCTKNSTKEDYLTNSTTSMDDLLPFFIAGQILQGIGSTPIYVLGMVFIDESVTQAMSSLYIGIFSAMFVGGAALGFAVGSSLLNLYIDWPYIDPVTVGLTPESDLWLGCWWLCFLLSGCAAILVAIPLLAYPRKLPRKNAMNSKSYLYSEEGENSSDRDVDTNLVSFLQEIRKVCQNGSFMFLTLAEAGPAFLGSGLGAFMPKLIENQFNMSASSAALYVGFAGVPSGCLGSFFGGWFLKKYNIDCRQCLKICTLGAVGLLLSSFAFLIHCDNPDFAGIFLQYEKTSSPPLLPNLSSPCNSDCGCDGVSYNPVCGANGIIYYSPCHAGCTEKRQIDKKEIFQKCNCIQSIQNHARSQPTNNSILTSVKVAIHPVDINKSSDSSNLNHSTMMSLPTEPSIKRIAVRDKCPSNCRMLSSFMGLLVVVTFIGFALSMPSVSAGLRCIDDNQKTMAFGLRAQLSRLIGSIPGPIVFGLFIDKTCVQWQELPAGGRGSCVVYELTAMNNTALYLSLLSRGLDFLFYALAWWWYVPSSRLKTRVSVEEYSDTLSLLPPPEDTTEGDINYVIRHR